MSNSGHAGGLANRFDLLVQSITDYAIYMLDRDGVVTTWNAGAQRFKGYAPAEIIGLHFSRFYSEADRAAGVPERALETARTEGRFEAEGWRVRKDGTTFWAHVVIDPIFDESGALVGYAKITRDLSERKAAQEELRRSEERFRLLIQSVTDYAIYMLDPAGLVSSWNAGAERFKGYTEEEILGSHFSRFYTEDERNAGVPQNALRSAREEGRFEAEGWRVRKDGSRFWATVVIDPIHGPDGNLLGFAKITRDLSERRLSQQALDQAREAFFQSQKMEAIGKLTGGVAHDFNNLLAAIIGSLDLARRRLSQGGEAMSFIDNAFKAAERGATLTQRMLAFARKQDLKLENVDLASSVLEMAELLGHTLGPAVTVETRFPLHLPQVRTDRAQLELALINLVVNARDAMPDGGAILLTAGEVELTEAPESARRFVRLSVIDSGEGMDEGTLAQATEPFFTTKGVGKGTGLGLSMVQGMIEQCGGRLELSSTPGEGTTAQLWLPVATALAEHREPEAAEGPAAETSRLTVLAVDDDALVLLNTVSTLGELGHRVLQASSGAEAMRVMDSQPIDLLLTDYAMPGMTGVELAEAARKRWPALRVLMVSGYADLPEGSGTDISRLAKPFRLEQLDRAIAQATANKAA